MFAQGVVIGFGLALLVGPIIVLLLQLALRDGQRAAWLAALGIWSSDLMYLLAAHFGTVYLMQALAWPGFERLIGTIGALVLFGVGWVFIRRGAADSFDPNHDIGERPRHTGRYLWQGFAINTFNPFPIFFWSTVALTMVHQPKLNGSETFSLYAGILSTIIVTDSIKIAAAGWLRKHLTPTALLWVARVGGGLLGLFGVILLLRIWVFT